MQCKEIATKYQGDTVDDALIAKIKNGGVGACAT